MNHRLIKPIMASLAGVALGLAGVAAHAAEVTN